MPVPDLASLERHLEALLLDLNRLQRTRPRPPDVLARAEAGRQIDELIEEIAELQRWIKTSPAETLQDAAVKLRRLRGPTIARRVDMLPETHGEAHYHALEFS